MHDLTFYRHSSASCSCCVQQGRPREPAFLNQSLVCSLAQLPEAITELTVLAKLDCSNNAKITALPAGLGEAQPSLCEVIANKCKIAEFPASLNVARGLRCLSLSGNVISSLPDEALQGAIRSYASPLASCCAPCQDSHNLYICVADVILDIPVVHVCGLI